VGIDCFEKKWFHLSSQIGYLQIGGRQTNPFLSEEFRNVEEVSNFIHLNTIFRAHLKNSSGKIFVGVGPYLNVLINNDTFDSSLFEGFTYQRLQLGSRAEFGINHDINNFRVGVLNSYMLGLSSIASTEFMKINADVISVTLTLGYRISEI